MEVLFASSGAFCTFSAVSLSNSDGWCCGMQFAPSVGGELNGSLPVQLRLVCQPYNSVVVRILPPYVPSEREVAQPRLFADNVRRLFSQELRLPLVEQVTTCRVRHWGCASKRMLFKHSLPRHSIASPCIHNGLHLCLSLSCPLRLIPTAFWALSRHPSQLWSLYRAHLILCPVDGDTLCRADQVWDHSVTGWAADRGATWAGQRQRHS